MQSSKRTIGSIGLTIGTALGSAAAMYVLYPLTFVLIAMAVLLAHEFGHYLSAVFNDGAPTPPIFIPLGVGTLGITRVRNLPKLSSRTKRYIILSGPVGGAVCAASLVPLALLTGASSMVIPILLTLAWEIFNGTLGSDGKRWRQG